METGIGKHLKPLRLSTAFSLIMHFFPFKGCTLHLSVNWTVGCISTHRWASCEITIESLIAWFVSFTLQKMQLTFSRTLTMWRRFFFFFFLVFSILHPTCFTGPVLFLRHLNEHNGLQVASVRRANRHGNMKGKLKPHTNIRNAWTTKTKKCIV